MKTSHDTTILFVDDEPDLILSLRRFLRKEPYRTLFADGGANALDIMASEKVDIIVTDLRMPNMDGMELLAAVKKRYPDVIRMILSATQDIDRTIDAINTGEVYRFISKPLEPEMFKEILLGSVEYHLLRHNSKTMISEIEKRLLHEPSPQNLPGLSMGSFMLSAGNLGGDFADYYVYDDNHMDILIGDVVGKGIQSALVAASLKHLFAKSLAMNDCKEVPRMVCPHNTIYDMTKFSTIVSMVHGMCIERLQELNMFATLVYARLDLVTGKLGFIDCGHTSIIHFRKKTGTCDLLKGLNLPMGMSLIQDYQVMTADISPGDVIVFYSDGITEADSESGELFGENRLSAIVANHSGNDPQDIADAILKEIKGFRGKETLGDDASCIVLRIASREVGHA